MLRSLRNLFSDLTQAQCCFCGETVQGETPVSITLDLGDGQSQHMYAHSKCIATRLHPSMPYIDSNELDE